MKPLNKVIINKDTSFNPIWIMRQAGRYLPEYRKIRSKATFHQMMHKPDLMTEVTLLPMKRFELDAAIMFSDILVIPESLGMKFDLVPKVGPVFNNRISNDSDIKNLNYNNDYFKNIYKGISSIRSDLNNDKSLIGFAGAPWTVACYMLEGKPSKDYMSLRSLMIEKPDSFNLLMEKITDATINYIDGQIKSGVNVIQIFDSNGTYISKDHYEKYSLPYISKIIRHINSRNIPSIYLYSPLKEYIASCIKGERVNWINNRFIAAEPEKITNFLGPSSSNQDHSKPIIQATLYWCYFAKRFQQVSSKTSNLLAINSSTLLANPSITYQVGSHLNLKRRFNLFEKRNRHKLLNTYVKTDAYSFNATDRKNLLKDVMDKNKEGIKHAESLAEKILNQEMINFKFENEIL